ncbi:MAG: SecDF P1 head subdomain-containing protein, partial [Burkholderiales bacterium]
MNRYPLWKYLVIGIALLLGFFYTLPNLFGENPAVQILPAKSALKVDTALLARVEEALVQANVSAQGAFLDVNTIKVRFADTDTQLKAKDLLQAKLGDDYVVALNLLSSSPKWLSSIGALPMYLGLDLRGGVHFLLQVDMKAALDKAADRYVADIRGTLRDKKIAYTGVARDGQTVNVKFRDAESRAKAAAEIGKNFPDLALKEADENGEPKLIATLTPPAQTKIQEYSLQQNITTLRNRVNELGVAEPIIQQQGAERVVVQLPGVQDTAKAKDILGRTASLEVRMVDEEHGDAGSLEAAAKGQLPVGDELYRERNGAPVLVKKAVVLTGERISDAQPGYDGQSGEPAVHISLDGAGARTFQLLTRENVGKRMAILL